MATHTQVIVTDDLDGTDGAHTVAFSFAGSSYEIDLTDDNLGKFADVLEPYIQAATPVRAKGKAKSNDSSKNAEIRAWARTAGFDLGERGRIPREVKDAYAAQAAA